jgi:excisionase family DNA binding protein
MNNPFETIENKLILLEGLIRNLKNETKTSKPDIHYLSRQEVADLLKISLPTLNEYTRTGIIQGSRIGSRVLYDETAVREAVKEIPTHKYKRG